MPQVFQVLKCYKCSVFQVHQTKKSNKYQCKMCGEKQSIKRHYGLGNGLECRKHVQKLNAMRGEIDESKHNSDNCSEDEFVADTSNVVFLTDTKIENNSKWSDFVDTEEVIEQPKPSNDTMYLNDTEVVLELPKKRQKSLGRFTKNRKYTKTSKNNSDYDNSNIYNQATANNDTSQNLSMHETYYKEQLTTTNINKSNNQHLIDNLKPINTKQEKPISKWSHQPTNKSNWFESENTHCIKDINHPSHSQPKIEKENKCFVPPALNKDSKWAKFADDATSEVSDEDEENYLCFNATLMQYNKSGDDNHANSLQFDKNSKPLYSHNSDSYQDSLIQNSKTDSHKLFSLCDYNDIDDYLSI